MNENILLVDDEPGIRKVLGISLAEMGYTVFTAENGEEGLALFREKTPEIVVTDIKMPGMDGIRLLREIKRLNPETEVIVITGHGDMDLAIRSLKNEATDFITKPIDDNELETALRKARNNLLIRRKLRDYTETLEHLVQTKTERLVSLETREGGGENGDASAELYRDFFEGVPGYVTVVDRNWTIRAANRRFREDFALDESEEGVACYRLLKHGDAPCEDCPAAKTFQSGKSSQAELEIRDREGRKRKVMAWTSPLTGSDGATERVMVMATDIGRILDLKDHLSSLGLMIGSISHGIKGLLTGLDGGVYLLDSGVSRDDKERVTEGLQMVKLMSGKIKNMVLDILYYTKERELKFVPVNVVDFAAEVAESLRPKMEQQGIVLAPEIDESLFGIECALDGEQLRVALVNILENAMDACAEQKAQDAPRVTFRAGVADGEIVFEIADNGVGMDEATREKVFELFFSSKASRGTGIGLVVTQKIVSQHGGRIGVESEPGKGTTFFVRIPLRNEGGNPANQNEL
jgi:signal transduction histidine kinase/FixJ family two-component response regulator